LNAEPTFAERIRARYPEGLTGLFAIGGTRTTYILEHNRQKAQPGVIEDFQHYSDYLLDRYFDMCRMFLGLGGHNMVITALGYQSFYERGEQYAEFVAKSTLALIGEQAVRYYQQLHADPYFLGIDTLLLLPERHPGHQLASALQDFQNSWDYAPEQPKIIWEIASIPLFTFWNTARKSSTENEHLRTQLDAAGSLQSVFNLVYEHFSQDAYGGKVPLPHFYLGTNRNGDLKLRSVIPNSFIGGSECRLYYTPYPTLFMTQDAMQTMLEDLAFGEQRFRSKTMDHRDAYTPEIAEAEYRHFRALSADPTSILGLSRKGSTSNDDN
jgi:hypothetical protein